MFTKFLCWVFGHNIDVKSRTYGDYGPTVYRVTCKRPGCRYTQDLTYPPKTK